MTQCVPVLLLAAMMLSAANCIDAVRKPPSDEDLARAKTALQRAEEELAELVGKVDSVERAVEKLRDSGIVTDEQRAKLDELLGQRRDLDEKIAKAREHVGQLKGILEAEQKRREEGGNPSPLWALLLQLGLAYAEGRLRKP